MSKWKRTKVGSFCKSKPPEPGKNKQPNYIKLEHNVTSGTYIQLESKEFQLKSLEEAVKAGKLGGENAEKARERINKIPDFVLAECYVVSKNE